MIINGELVTYFLENRRGRSLRLEIKDGQIYLFKPRWVTQKVAQDFLVSQKKWLERNLKKEREQIPLLPLSARDSLIFKKELQTKLEKFNQVYHFSWRQISIRHQTTRWGSCSPRGTLSFNSRLKHLPDSLQDYIVVHELCHLREANHSAAFWRLVERAIPNYLERRRQLKHYRLANFIDNNNLS